MTVWLHVAWAGVLVIIGFVHWLRSRRVPDPVIRAVLDHLGEEVAVYDPQGIVIRANEAWLAEAGSSGVPLPQFFDAKDPVAAWMKECRDSRKSLGSLFCHRNGRPVYLRLTPLVDRFGELVGGIAVVTPASFQTQTESLGLTARESDLVVQVLQGRSYREAALAMGISEATVKTHLKNIFLKTGSRSRHELAARFRGGQL